MPDSDAKAKAAERRAGRRAKILARGSDRLKYLQGQTKELDKSEVTVEEKVAAATIALDAQNEPLVGDEDNPLIETRPAPKPSTPKPSTPKPAASTSTDKPAEDDALSKGIDALLNTVAPESKQSHFALLKRQAALKKVTALHKFFFAWIFASTALVIGLGYAATANTFPYTTIAQYQLSPWLVYIALYCTLSSGSYLYRRMVFPDVFAAPPADTEGDLILPAALSQFASTLDKANSAAEGLGVVMAFVEDLVLFIFFFVIGWMLRDSQLGIGVV